MKSFSLAFVVLVAVLFAGCGRSGSKSSSTLYASDVENTAEQYHVFQWVAGPSNTYLVAGFDEYDQAGQDGIIEYRGYNPGVYILGPDKTVQTLPLPRVGGRSSNFYFANTPVYPSHGKRAYAILGCNELANGQGNRIPGDTKPLTTYALTMWTLPMGTPKVIAWLDENSTGVVTTPAASDLPYIKEFRRLNKTSNANILESYDAHAFEIKGQTWER